MPWRSRGPQPFSEVKGSLQQTGPLLGWWSGTDRVGKQPGLAPHHQIASIDSPDTLNALGYLDGPLPFLFGRRDPI